MRLLDRVGEQAHLVGHSYGGAVALHAARTRGGRFRSLVLIEPVAFHLLADRAEIAAVADGVRAGRGERRLHRRLPPLRTSTGAAREAGTPFRRQARGDGAADGEGRDRVPRRVQRARAARRSRRIAVPTLLVRGERSPQPTRRICELLAATLRDARLRTVEGAGHMAPLTHATRSTRSSRNTLHPNSRRFEMLPGKVAVVSLAALATGCAGTALAVHRLRRAGRALPEAPRRHDQCRADEAHRRRAGADRGVGKSGSEPDFPQREPRSR